MLTVNSYLEAWAKALSIKDSTDLADLLADDFSREKKNTLTSIATESWYVVC